MGITLKNIVEILNIDAPVFYIDKENMKKENYIFFKCISDTEVKDILEGKHDINKQYDNSDIGIYFPQMDIHNYFKLEINRNPVAIEVHINNILEKIEISVNEYPLMWVIYCILHEYGHYLHFQKSNLTSFDYSNRHKEERIKDDKIVNYIKGIPDDMPFKLLIAKDYHKNIYMKYSDEKYADEYAMEHIVEAYHKVKQHI